MTPAEIRAEITRLFGAISGLRSYSDSDTHDLGTAQRALNDAWKSLAHYQERNEGAP